MIRLFVALSLPDLARRHLMLVSGGLPGARWVAEPNLHLTLRFIGEVDRRMAEDIDDALARVRAKPFSVTIAGLDTFGSSDRRRILWAGVERNRDLVELRDRVEASLVRCGVTPETRKFSPHVSLAKLGDAQPARLAAFLQGQQVLRLAPFVVDRFVLYSSWLGSGDPVYRAEADYKLSS